MKRSRGPGHAALRCGELNGRAILTTAAVIEMRRVYALGGTSLREMAADAGVHHSCVWAVIHARTWGHVGGSL